jgi:hypothetical protein
MDISVSIVNYYSQKVIYRCLESLRRSNWHNLEYEIILVDNSNESDLAAVIAKDWPEVRYIANSNTGYGAGNNLALKQSLGKYFLIMNPDTVVESDSIWHLYSFMESHPQVGVVGPGQRNLDGSRQASCYRWHRLITPFCRRWPWLSRFSLVKNELSRFLLTDINLEQSCSVDWLLGSFLLVRAAAMRQVGYFDERYKLYFEDTDLCRQLWYYGWQVIYFPLVEILHNHQRASAQLAWYKVLNNRVGRQHTLSWIKYLLKWGLFASTHIPKIK